MGLTPKDLERYTSFYSSDKFWKKMGRVAGKAGAKLAYYAMILYYALSSPTLPRKDRNIIIGALGYLILPVDLIPDFLPAIGFTDDIGALVLAVCKVASNITPEVKQQAEQKVYEWFGRFETPDFDIDRVDYGDKE